VNRNSLIVPCLTPRAVAETLDLKVPKRRGETYKLACRNRYRWSVSSKCLSNRGPSLYTAQEVVLMAIGGELGPCLRLVREVLACTSLIEQRWDTIMADLYTEHRHFLVYRLGDRLASLETPPFLAHTIWSATPQPVVVFNVVRHVEAVLERITEEISK